MILCSNQALKIHVLIGSNPQQNRNLPLTLYPPPACLDLLHILDSADSGSHSCALDNFSKRSQAKLDDALKENVS